MKNSSEVDDSTPPMWDHDTDEASAPMSRAFAYVVSMVCPGILWAHKGYLVRGIFINLLFVAAWVVYAAAWVWWKFYPVYPTLWFAGGWVFLLAMNARDAIAAPSLRSVPPRSMELGAFSIATWFGLLLIFSGFFSANIASVVTMRSASMFPTVLPGDVMLVDRSAMYMAWPRPGDVVLYRVPGESMTRMGRVVGLPGDLISFHDGDLVASRFPVAQGELAEPFASRFSAATGLAPEVVGARFESLGNIVYTVAGTEPNQSTQSFDEREWKIGDRELFILNDNRGHIDDSRAFGPIDVRQLIGMPIYVLRSSAGDRRLRRVRGGTAMQTPRSVWALQQEVLGSETGPEPEDRD